MKRSRTNIRVFYSTESLSETESGDDSEYLKSKFKKINGTNNNHDIFTNNVKAAMQVSSIKATDRINPMSKQWQPKVRLTRLSEKYTYKMLRPVGGVPNTTKKLVKKSAKESMEKSIFNGIAEISPIKFDKDESIVREYSPETADNLFSKRLKTIRDMMIMKEPNITTPQKRKRLLKKSNPELVKYEETLKRLQQKTEKKELSNSRCRKLYTHGNSFEEYDNVCL